MKYTWSKRLNFDFIKKENSSLDEVETLEHLAINYTKDARNDKRTNQILGEKGEEISWMNKILRKKNFKKLMTI